KRHRWRAPLYWQTEPSASPLLFTLLGTREIDTAEPVCHVSYYEADAYARWAGAQLPREEEWEIGAGGRLFEGNFLENGLLHPAPASWANDQSRQAGRTGLVRQLFGDVWEWTSS